MNEMRKAAKESFQQLSDELHIDPWGSAYGKANTKFRRKKSPQPDCGAAAENNELSISSMIRKCYFDTRCIFIGGNYLDNCRVALLLMVSNEK